MLTILNIFGTRPEAIKMMPVLKELKRHSDEVRSLVCVTGQHREQLDQVMALFNTQADFDLNVMQPNQGLSTLTTNILTGLDSIVKKVKPDWILAQGDTTTVLVAALAAYYHRVKFGHVEAGLRTGDRYQPFPEEMNRRLADVLADKHFVPTESGRRELLKEGIPQDRILITGNTVIDAILMTAKFPFDWPHGPLGTIPTDKRIILVTAHRRESFGESMRNICLAIRDIADDLSGQGVHVVYPVHLNPNVQKPVYELLSDVAGVSLIQPLDYLSLVHLMKHAELILTDSGGIQEEAPSFGVPVLVLRDKTERPEGVKAGVAKLVGTDKDKILKETIRLLTNREAYESMSASVNPYGDGQAAQRIVKCLLCEETS